VSRDRRRRHDEPVVQSVTSAPQSLADEQSSRIRRYLVTMGIRTACFLGAAVSGTQGAPWWVWGSFAVLAVVLPYIAVVMANAVRPRTVGQRHPVTPRSPGGPRRLGR
jgi:fatty acid desaturase